MSTAWVECWKCDPCGHRWIKGDLYPAQCAKCRSRKWDKPEQGTVKVRKPDPMPESPKTSMEVLRAICAGKAPEDTISTLVEMCSYTEYDMESGETYGCRLPAHSPKIKHQRGTVK